MAKRIPIVIDVNSESVTFATDSTLTLSQQIKRLKQELQLVPEGTKEWSILQKQFNETKDSLDRVNVKSKELFGTFSSLPGPIGDISGKLDSTVGVLKTFSGFKLSDVKSQFSELGKDLGGIVKGFGEVTGITKIYTTLNQGLSKSLMAVGVAEGAAATGAKVFSAALVATGIGAIVLLLGQLYEILSEVISGEKEAAYASKQFSDALESQSLVLELNQKDLKRRNALVLAQMKVQGVSEAEIIKTTNEQNYHLYQAARSAEQEAIDLYNMALKNSTSKDAVEQLKAARKNLNDREQATKDSYNNYLVTGYNARAQENKATEAHNKELADKAKTVADKALADKKKINEELSKADEEAFKAALSVRDREEYNINEKYAQQKYLAIQNGKDVTILNEGQQAELAAMRAKFAKEDDEFTKKIDDDILKEKEDFNKKVLEKQKDQLELESTQAKLKYDKGLESEGEYQVELYQIKLKYASTEQERQQAEIDFLEFAKGKQKEYEDVVMASNKAVSQSYLDTANNLGSTFLQIAGLFEKGSAAAKTFAVIGVLLNAAAAIGKVRLATAEAVADFGKAAAAGTSATITGTAMLPLNPIQGAALIASGTSALAASSAGLAAAKIAGTIQAVSIGVTSAAQIAAILSAGKDSKTASAAGGGTGSGGGTTPSFNGTVAVPAPVIAPSQASSTGGLGRTIAGAINENNSMDRPIRAYVIGDQVSTQQQLDRRISVASRMGG